LEVLEVLETFSHDYHETKDLRRCIQCGQLYFCEWLETVNYGGGEDSQDYALIPVATAEEGLSLSGQSRVARGGLPTLVMIWPPADAKPYWRNV
jgi:hypothetical protein